MTFRFLTLSLAVAASFAPLASMQAADSQSVTIKNDVQIPGASLKPGTYTFAVEDRLSDRAVVRVTSSQDSSEHYLLLSVPNSKLSADAADQLMLFKAANSDKQALRAWKCPTCAAPLEFVYPKLEAVAITDASAQPVLAVDPAYDKLPSNLSPDDMKVVTLWLLQPERITADNIGQGVKAAKYSATANQSSSDASTATAAQPTPAPATTPSETANPAPAQMASAQTDSSPAPLRGRKHLPKTASNTYLFGFLGLLCLAGALTLRVKRTYSS